MHHPNHHETASQIAQLAPKDQIGSKPNTQSKEAIGTNGAPQSRFSYRGATKMGNSEQEEPIPTNAIELAAHLIRQCQKCPLGATKTNAVPGEGPMDPVIMFIAEGPGKSEDQQGRPFMGQAGKFLDELLPMAGLSRDQVFITNMIKCRAPNNRDPEPEEIETCREHLDRQIIILDPKLIVTLGKFSTGKFLPGEPIGQARGKLRRKNGRFIYPIMHPAAGLRRGDFKEGVINDFKAIPEVLRQIEEDPPEEEPDTKPLPKKPNEDPNVAQNALF